MRASVPRTALKVPILSTARIPPKLLPHLLEKSYAHVKRALELRPDLAEAHLLEADLLFKARRYQEHLSLAHVYWNLAARTKDEAVTSWKPTTRSKKDIMFLGQIRERESSHAIRGRFPHKATAEHL